MQPVAGGLIATIGDVARHAGVNKSTASRVLSGTDAAVRIGAETRERVLKAAADLDYRANPFARAIRSARGRLLGVVALSLDHPFWITPIHAIERIAKSRDYYLLLREATADHDGTPAARQLLDDGVGALVLLGDVRVDADVLDAARDRGQVVVTVGSDLGRPDVPSIALDNGAAMRLALEHLVELGHTRIALSCGQLSWEDQWRTRAYRETVRTLGLPELIVPPRILSKAPPMAALLADGAAMLDWLLGEPQAPTAVVLTSALRAMGLLGEAYRRGVSVPDDLSVAAFELDALVEHTAPRLTSVAQRIEEQGRLAAELAVNVLEEKVDRAATRIERLDPRLTVRESTGPVKRRTSA